MLSSKETFHGINNRQIMLFWNSNIKLNFFYRWMRKWDNIRYVLICVCTYVKWNNGTGTHFFQCFWIVVLIFTYVCPYDLYRKFTEHRKKLNFPLSITLTNTSYGGFSFNSAFVSCNVHYCLYKSNVFFKLTTFSKHILLVSAIVRKK